MTNVQFSSRLVNCVLYATELKSVRLSSCLIRGLVMTPSLYESTALSTTGWIQVHSRRRVLARKLGNGPFSPSWGSEGSDSASHIPTTFAPLDHCSLGSCCHRAEVVVPSMSLSHTRSFFTPQFSPTSTGTQEHTLLCLGASLPLAPPQPFCFPPPSVLQLIVGEIEKPQLVALDAIRADSGISLALPFWLVHLVDSI